MDYLSAAASLYSWGLFAGLGLFLSLEWLVPFRLPIQSKFLHAATNLSVGGLNAVVMNLLFAGMLLAWTQRANSEGWGVLQYLGIGLAGNVIASVLVFDLIVYGAHWAHHKIPILWRFHRVHHSDLDLDVTTGLRSHLGEVLVAVGVRAVSIPIIGPSLLGVVVYELLQMLALQFKHSNIRMPDSLEVRLRRVIVTPTMHRVHHSQRPLEHNANYGTICSVWDRLFGTYRMRASGEKIQFGLVEYPLPDHVNLVRVLAMPLGAGCPQGPMA
jgi:sterol desaturase/sphingolipid hydroxylase (fatty acid hydroxylase superfamily)